MRRFITLLATACVLAACGGDAERDVSRKKRGKDADAAAGVVGAPAVRTHRLDFAACLAEDMTDDAAQTSRCPSFALLSLDYMSSLCAAHGGTLKARQPSEAWSLDVDGDASAEVLVDLVGNFDCEGAPTAFACGSACCSTRNATTPGSRSAPSMPTTAPASRSCPQRKASSPHCVAAASASSPAAS